MKALGFSALLFIFSFSAIPGNGGQADSTETNCSVIPGRLFTVIAVESTLYFGGLFYLNNVWYKDHESTPFHFYNDASGWMQIDKAGHMYASYYQGYYGMKALEWADVPKNKAIWYGGTLGILLQTPIEIFDGLHEGYGFSVTDMVANFAGSALLIGQELLWDEQRALMKFSYSPTDFPKYRPSYFGKTVAGNFFTDYNGHTYWLCVNVSRIMPSLNTPKWLNVALGFGADGMLGEFENPSFHRGELLPEFERSRQLYLSLDVDLREIPVKSKFLNTLLDALNMLKFPAPTLELHSSKGVRFHPVYF